MPCFEAALPEVDEPEQGCEVSEEKCSQTPSQERLAKLSAYATTMAHRFFDANQKIAIFRGIGSEELRGRLANSLGGHAYHVLARTLFFDLIRDVWAFTLDRDERAPSVANLWKQTEPLATRSALREQFDDSAALEWWGPPLPDDERERHMEKARTERRVAALTAFDQIIQMLETRVPQMLGSDLAGRLDVARKRAIAHFNMVKTDGGHEVFDVTTLGLRWEDPEDFLTQVEPIILELAGIVGRASFDVAEYKRVHKIYAEDMLSRIMRNASAQSIAVDRVK